MKTYPIFLAALLISFSSCIDGIMPHEIIEDAPSPHEILTFDFDLDSDSSYSPKEYCNETPRLLVDHQLSESGTELIQSFVNRDQLSFVPFGTENLHALSEAEIWTWDKTSEDTEWSSRKSKTIKCEENPDHYDKTYSMLRGTKVMFSDEKNGQNLKLQITGVFDCVNGIPVGIKEEVFSMMFQNNVPFWCDPVVKYSTNEMNPNNLSNILFPEVTIHGKTFSDLIMMETTNNSHHFQIFMQKSKGIVLIHNLITDMIWEPIENVKPLSVVALEEQRDSGK